MSNFLAGKVQAADQHREVVDVTTMKRPHVLMVVANPTTATTTGWPVGFWASELIDPRDPSKWSSEDLISMGFVNTPELVALLEDTPTLAELDLDLYDAIVVCGGLAPMWQFRDSEDLKKTVVAFYEAEKPTAALCHGVSGLIDVQLSDGSYLVEGKTVTGFANVEEDFSDAAVGQKVVPFRVEDELRERGANYVQGGRFKSFVVRDGRLITGQQHFSGAKLAEAVIAAIGV